MRATLVPAVLLAATALLGTEATAVAVAAPTLRELPAPSPDHSASALGVTPSGLVVGNARQADSFDQQAVTWRGGKLLPLDPNPSQAIEFNSRDQVVGTRRVGGVSSAVLWSGGRTTDLLPPGAVSAVGLGISEVGEVLVRAVTESGPGYLFATWRAGVWRTISTDGHLGRIGPRGDVAVSSDSGTHVYRAGSGAAVAVPNPFGGGYPPEPTGINARGDVLFDLVVPEGGYRVGFWRDGVLTDIGTLGGNQAVTNLPGVGRGPYLNDAGEVTGTSETASGAYHAFRWRAGTITDLTPASPLPSTANSINQAGQVAGTQAVEVGGARTSGGRIWPRHGVPVEFAPTGAQRSVGWLAIAPYSQWVVGADNGPNSPRRAISSR
ncbi:hypothetical protein [Actinokineospora spheciospongiae]|uniref:hypothetical protein n=1 Tax=Actinokineospora spheciospongiae TaxID=909613 RepID=UPI000D8DF413|nr:hypothetical protein [Actinokineospora spheciospongiae]PWW66658.1 putative HAF family extracellular repeat protein [Actinokineospora spheciospongiae]